jgi:hypothetical protein
MINYDKLVALFDGMPPGIEKNWIAENIKICKPVDSLMDDEVRVRLGNADLDLGINLIPGTRNENTTPIDGIVNHEMRYYNLKNCKLFHNGLVLSSDNTLYVDEFRVTSSNWREEGFKHRFAEDVGFNGLDLENNTAVVSLHGRKRKIKEPSFFFNSNTAQSHYGHVIHDTLAQIIAYDYLCEKLGVTLKPIAVGPFFLPIQYFLFNNLIKGASSIEFIAQREVVEAEDCYLATNALFCPEKHEVAINAAKYLKDKILKLSSAKAIDGLELLFVNRNDIPVNRGQLMLDGKDYSLVWDPGRNISNMSEAETIAVGHGFKSLTLTKFNASDTLAIMRGVKIAIGPHGGGLYNLILAENCEHLIELCDYPSSWESVYTFTTACGTKVHKVPAYTQDGLIYTDLDKIKSLINELL